MTHLAPNITLCHVCSQEPSCVTLRATQTRAPFPTKNEVLGFKKDSSRIKEISFLFHMFFFQLSTNNTKKIICLKSRTCHECQSLVQTGFIPSKICNLVFNYTKILHWFFFYVTSGILIKYPLPPNLPSRRITENV